MQHVRAALIETLLPEAGVGPGPGLLPKKHQDEYVSFQQEGPRRCLLSCHQEKDFSNRVGKSLTSSKERSGRCPWL